MRNLLTLAAAAFGMLALTGNACADTVYTLVNGTVTRFGGTYPPTNETLSGTITFDSSFTPTAANLTFDPMDGTPTLSGFTVATSGGIAPVGAGSAYPGTSFFDAFITNPGDPGAYVNLDIDLPATAGGALVICGSTNMCQDQPFEASSYLVIPTTTGVTGVYEFQGASLLVPQVTPEPSSLLLLGTGALGVLGLARRRF